MREQYARIRAEDVFVCAGIAGMRLIVARCALQSGYAGDAASRYRGIEVLWQATLATQR